MSPKYPLVQLAFACAGLFAQIVSLAQPDASASLAIVLAVKQGEQKEVTRFLLDPTQARYKKFKLLRTHEKDPSVAASTQTIEWRGFLLSQLLDQVLTELTVDQRAQFDLVVLKNERGQKALVPRAFLSRYSLILAMEKNGQKQVYPSSIVQWSSNAKLQKEGLVLETFFLEGVSTIELANYRDRFGSYFLKRRTDPVAMRGEKLFVQNCVGCHGAGTPPEVKRLSQGGHPIAQASVKPSDKDLRALLSYLEAYKAENANASVSGLPSPTAVN